MLRIKQLILAISTVAFIGTGMLAPVQAAMLPTQDFLRANDREASLAVIDASLMRADVQQQLEALGVEPADAIQRISSLPDEDLAAMAEQLDALPAGGDSLLAVVGIVFIVLIILELTGVTNIFNNF